MSRARGAARATTVLTILVLGVSALMVTPAAAQRAMPAAPASPPIGDVPDLSANGWQPVFDDEFNGSSVDESVWDIWERSNFGAMVRSAVSESGGNLTLTTYTDPADGVTKSGAMSTGDTAGGSAGNQRMFDGFRSAYGYVEARVKVGDKAGTGDSFWLMSDNGNNSLPFGDPATDGPEIDIMEHGNGPDSNGDTNGDGKCDWNGQATTLGVPCNELLSDGSHWDGFEEDHKSGRVGFVKNPTATPLTNNFHDYAMLWTPTEWRLYVDGKETMRTAAGASFNPAHMMLTAVAGPGNYGPLGDARNDHMVVDYIKVWQRPVSDVPDQSTAANTPLTVPFNVTDYTYNSASKPDPGTVAVTATSSNTTVVPASGLTVAGNGPADPDGSFTNGDFESGSTGWTLTGGAAVWSTQHHTGANSVHLPVAGGKATQTITGLRTNTTYVADANFNLDLEFTDSNGNNRVDPGETFTDPADKRATFKWGVQDVDSALAGDQTLSEQMTRDGAAEQTLPAWVPGKPWPADMLKFTTGPTTTSVTLFADNIPFVGTADDSSVSFDSVIVRPLVPATRVLTVRPADGKVGSSTITLTAKDATGTTIGTDTFLVTVGAGSLQDGSFEAGTATTPWTLMAGAQIVTPNAYKPDRQLLLAQSTADTVTQHVTGLSSNTRYRLDVTGEVSASGGSMTLAVHNFGATDINTTLTTTTQSTQSIEFVTGASSTSADVLLLDWAPADGTSTAEKVTLSQCTSTTSCASLATDVGSTAPPAVSASPRSTVSGQAIAIPVNLPSGATLSGAVTSTNKVLVPDSNVTVVTSSSNSRRKVITASPLPDRTGLTKLHVVWTGATGSPVDIPLTVSDKAMLQPGFEKSAAGWALSGSATAVTSGQRSGASALQINGAGTASQTVSGLPHGSGYEFGAWVNGTVTVTLKTVPIDQGEQPATLGSATLTGSGYTEGKLAFQTLLVPDSGPESWRGVSVVLSNGTGQNGTIDDAYLVHRPVIRRIRDLSLHSGQTAPDWNTHRDITYGRVADNAVFDPTAFTVTSSDISGFGSGVVPAGNLSPLHFFNQAWPFATSLDAKASTKTGRSLITVKLTDPATGNFSTQSYNITVNAGNNFWNGDFERSAFGGLGASNGQWGDAWLNDSVEITRKQGWGYLGVPGANFVGPRDDGKVLRISSGAADSDLITGLTPSTNYTLKFRAKGDGSTFYVKDHADIVFAPVLGSVAISPPDTTNVWRDYTIHFTTNASGNGSTSVILYVIDADTGDRNGDGTVDANDAVKASDRACAIYAAGESCIDDVGLFKTSDVP